MALGNVWSVMQIWGKKVDKVLRGVWFDTGSFKIDFRS